MADLIIEAKPTSWYYAHPGIFGLYVFMQKDYTKNKDHLTTSGSKNQHVAKDDLQIEVYGTIDELNSSIGITACSNHNIPENISIILNRIQIELSKVIENLYNPDEQIITKQYVSQLEKEINELNDKLPPLNSFIVPGGNAETSTCHLSRAICRRAERRLITLSKRDNINNHIVQYMNRLSDLLFVIARTLM